MDERTFKKTYFFGLRYATFYTSPEQQKAAFALAEEVAEREWQKYLQEKENGKTEIVGESTTQS